MPTFPFTLYRTPADWGATTYATAERARELFGELCADWYDPKDYDDDEHENLSVDPIYDCDEFTLAAIDGDQATYSRSLGRGKFETVTVRADQFGDFTEV